MTALCTRCGKREAETPTFIHHGIETRLCARCESELIARGDIPG